VARKIERPDWLAAAPGFEPRNPGINAPATVSGASFGAGLV
jgi:hypothetical protein